MIEKLGIDESELARGLESQYNIHIEHMKFIPLGDSAYSYQVTCSGGQQYYLKLFDHNNGGQLIGIDKLDDYLPLIWYMYQKGLFVNLACPIETAEGSLKCELSECTVVLYDFIEGETLAEAYPFSDEIVTQVAKLVAQLHMATSYLEPSAKLSDNFDISFAIELKDCISDLEHCDANGDSFLAKVKQQVLSKKDRIYELLELTCGLRGSAVLDSNHPVLCHGDVWGGNLIQRYGQLFMLDWESMQFAPRELDLVGYIGDEFERFYTAYTKQLGYAVKVNSDILRFYSYRHHLRNLNNWLQNILYRNLNCRQKENDLEMIRAHCMDRWDLIEPRITQMEAVLQRTSSIVNSECE